MGRVSLLPASVKVALAGSAAWLVALCAFASPARGAGVAGRVVLAEDPVAKATVYAYRVVERSFDKVATDDTGRFLFDALPAGLYKIVAHKVGLTPAVLVLARRSAEESQFVEVELSASRVEPEDDYWSTRASVPGDVLRDLDVGSLALASAVTRHDALPRFAGEVTAVAAHSDLASRETNQIAGTEVALHGLLGALRVELQGEIERAGTKDSAGSLADAGRASSFRLGLAGENGREFEFEGRSREWFEGSELAPPMALDQLRVRYDGELGDEIATTIAANYLGESGLFKRGHMVPAVIPYASRWLTVEGGYALPLGELGSLKGGVRYRENEFDRMRAFDDASASRYLDLWSKGDVEVDSTYVIEYGFFSTFRDGRVSVSPRGGVVLHFNPEWQASVSGSQRFVVSDEHPLENDFMPATVESLFACDGSEATCYQAEIAHGDGGEPSFVVGGSWREFDRTVQMFLQDDLLFGGDGLFFVPGDEVPEIRATWRRQFGDKVVASWSTSFAEGGGGAFQAANRRAYFNNVEYLHSSIDTLIEPTATGIFLAFHRVEQRLEANQPQNGRNRTKSPSTELDRLELVVSQDLSQIFNLAQSWAVKVGMELVRGESFVNPIDEGGDTRRRITTGVAVRF